MIPVPIKAVKAGLGEMGEVALLSSTRVVPRRLQESGYVFRHPHLPGAFRFLLGTTSE